MSGNAIHPRKPTSTSPGRCDRCHGRERGDRPDDGDGGGHADRLLSLPTQSDVVEPDGRFVPPPDLAHRIAATAMPASSEQLRRWSGYAGQYPTGRLGAMDPLDPTSRFYVDSGVPYLDAAEDGTRVCGGRK